jgi:hypothetical protein
MRKDKAPIYRLYSPLFLAGICLLALWAAAPHGARAAPVNIPDVDTGLHLGPIAANGAYTMYFPLAFRKHGWFTNGGFESGLQGWTTGRGPFDGHGSGLTQQVISFNGGQRALLGQEGELPAGTLPVGYGTLAQAWTVNQRYLSLDYWVFSYDNAKTDRGYFDTFEVSISRPPADITNSERDAQGCNTGARLNPGGTLFVSGPGLVFCGGRPGESSGILWDTGGWKTVTLDLNAFRGQNVTLYLTLWSREYQAPFYNDRAWFNTWVYVDNVRPID